MMDYFDKIIANLTSKEFDENNYYTHFDEFDKSLIQSINICEQNSDKIHEGGGEDDYWFIVLKKLYDIHNQVRSETTEERKKFYDEFFSKISDDITDLLEKMCSYVSIQAIINVTFIINLECH